MFNDSKSLVPAVIRHCKNMYALKEGFSLTGFGFDACKAVVDTAGLGLRLTLLSDLR